MRRVDMLDYGVIPDSERRRELQTAKAISAVAERAANLRRINSWNKVIKSIENTAENGYRSCEITETYWLKDEDVEELISKGYIVTYNSSGDLIIKWG